jgi:hypothetical protein
MTVIGLGLFYLAYGKAALSKAHILWEQWHCMKYADHSGAAVFGFAFRSIDLAEFLSQSPEVKVVIDNAYQKPIRAGYTPLCWKRLWLDARVHQWPTRPFILEGTIFLGTLAAANGEPKLVAVNITARHTNTSRGWPAIVTYVITPEGLRTSMSVTQQLFDIGPEGNWHRDGLRIFPGRADSLDSSKFEARVSAGHLLDDKGLQRNNLNKFTSVARLCSSNLRERVPSVD